jgi:hypothetical protein
MKVLAHTAFTAVALGLALAAAPGWAQQVWRCGPAGNQFSQQPCADGQALALAAPPSADAVAQARQVAQSEQTLAKQLRQQRLQQEAGAGGGAINLTPAASSSKVKASRPAQGKAAQKTPAKPAKDAFSAVAVRPS